MNNDNYETKMVEPKIESKVKYASKPNKGVSINDLDQFLKSRGYKSKADAVKDGWTFD